MSARQESDRTPCAPSSLGAAPAALGSDRTACIVDAGDGGTHVVPIVDGYVVTSAIRASPLCGAASTALVHRRLRESGEPLPAEGSLEFCRYVLRSMRVLLCDAIAYSNRARGLLVFLPTVSACGSGRAQQPSDSSAILTHRNGGLSASRELVLPHRYRDQAPFIRAYSGASFSGPSILLHSSAHILPSHLRRAIKERLGYTCRDYTLELRKLQSDPASIARSYQAKTGASGSDAVTVAAERFLAPEAFFSPEVAGLSAAPLHHLVDGAIQASPIDARRKLYSNILLSVRARSYALLLSPL